MLENRCLLLLQLCFFAVDEVFCGSPNLIHALTAINFRAKALMSVILNHWERLHLKGIETFFDGFDIVICPTTGLTTLEKACFKLVL
mmetsp:Transcript_8358/g.14611  ORF Transcript_8358/g.14611 Transcript_8358/m.14611 type:complete len:87 (-) Transcript_8358:127-387(-)